ncbi:MAG: hypothetical protein AB7G48_01445 [Nitrospiraceae bacterium]
MTLVELVADFADGLVAVDSTRTPHKEFHPGIGPYGEAQAVSAALKQMKTKKPELYARAATKRLPDILILGHWALELKIVRPFGDNGKPAEHWSENVLHPYPGNTSSLGDCIKLLECALYERKAILIFGYEHNPPQVHLEQAIASFEVLAKNIMKVRLGERVEELQKNLVHPVHQQLRVYGFEVAGKL